MNTDDHDSSSEDSTSLSPERTQYIEYCSRVIATIAEINECISERRPCMTFTQSGDKWVGELFKGHPDRFYSSFRMSKRIFIDLLDKLERDYGLRGSRRTTTREILAITLHILAHADSMRLTRERFQYSTETINRHFFDGLRALLLLSVDIVKPVDPNFRDIPVEIRHDPRYMPFFRDCIGAIDGTHINARVPVDEQIRYIGRNGTPTQNVMTACDFNMCFIFALAGWEGSAHDNRIFARALMDSRLNFPHPPQGKYYLVDTGYPQKIGYLKPYPDTRYYLADYAHGSHPVQGMHEHFNKTHSALRSVIERTFIVWKKKWCILSGMPQCSFKTQRSIVLATIALHNFIRRHSSRCDPEFSACDADDSFILSEADDTSIDDDFETDMFDAESFAHMSIVRDNIAEELYNAHR